MQLFISLHYTLQDKTITIYDERIIHQCFHVLRYKPWQILQLQDNDKRYTLSITNISKKEIHTDIIKSEQSTLSTLNSTLCIALPNRRDKAELMVQKCTEIGIDTIVFWKSERSILRDMPDKKKQRLETIACEASEQCFRRSLPTITYLDNLIESDILSSGQIILFYQDGIPTKEINSFKAQHPKFLISIVGPEWWFSTNEINQLQTLPNITTISLWDTILRMETATIIWSRLIKNSF